jgi:glycosyltransferase involved in cell wall biosynthesis
VTPPAPLQDVGTVVIGRNEGAALHACLYSVVPRVAAVVYVDSGSTDDSVAFAKEQGVEVVDLDTSVPFTAARARDAGLQKLLELQPGLTFVQFVDGDCEVNEAWLDTAHDALMAGDKLAVVCGRRRERFPAATKYNRHCDMEWDTPVGEAKTCGGDAMMRIEAYKQAGGFNTSLICGEEPELCIRIRRSGWTIQRLDAEMTLHDAKMTTFSQFWKRSVRGGWAYAEGSAMHGKAPESHCKWQSINTFVYGWCLPCIGLGLAWWTYGISLIAMLLIYARHVWAVRNYRIKHGDEPGHALMYAKLATIAKLPEVIGMMDYWIKRLLGKQATIIEYKPSGTPASTGDA